MIPIDSDSKHNKSQAILKNGALFAYSSKTVPWRINIGRERWWNTMMFFRRTYRESYYDFKKRTSPDKWYCNREWE